MRFYLNVPLVVGYVSMALVATLGMLQFAASRGGYQGLALFIAPSDPQARKRGAYLGGGLTVGALLLYVSLAPEILTPGPAGTEVAEMFALCALTSLGISLSGAGLRLKRAHSAVYAAEGGEAIDMGIAQARLYPTGSPDEHPVRVVVVLPDPAGFILTPPKLLDHLRQAGLSVLLLDLRRDEDKLYHLELLSDLSAAISQLTHRFEAKNLCVGLLGLGLGGDAALRAAAVDPQVDAALAAQPVLRGEKPSAGLPLLRELSYFQAWRWGWKRRRQQREQIAAKLDALGALKESFCQAAGALGDQGRETRDVRADWLVAPTDRRFDLMEEETVLEMVTSWFKHKLSTPANEVVSDAD